MNNIEIIKKGINDAITLIAGSKIKKADKEVAFTGLEASLAALNDLTAEPMPQINSVFTGSTISVTGASAGSGVANTEKEPDARGTTSKVEVVYSSNKKQ